MSDTNSGHWLTVSQAAAALAISEKTVRKRLNAGEIPGEKESLPQGGVAWRVPADWVEARRKGNGSESETRRNETEGKGSESEDDLPSRNPNGSETEDRVGSAPEAVLPEMERAGTGTEAILQALSREKDARIADLQSQIEQQRLQIEASNRMAAEATAALREALKMSQRALPASSSEQADKPASEPQQATKNAEQGRAGQTPKSAPHREARPFWKVFLGLR